MPARRAVVRWAWRMFRREWRQQALVLVLLTAAVAAVVAGISIAYNGPRPPDAKFGTASEILRYDVSGSQALDAKVSAARRSFGTIDAIPQAWAPIPGSAETVEIRGQDPHGVYGARMLGLLKGRYPVDTAEAAVTDEVASTFKVGVGDQITLNGRGRTVVGLVENPADLEREFVLVRPSGIDRPQSVSILVKGGWKGTFSLPQDLQGVSLGTRGEDGMGVATAMLGIATIGLLLVSLVAAAGFVVVAQRRLRQLGMLAAIGATERHLRLVTLANGALVGAVAAMLGALTGLVCWAVVAPRLEPITAHRIDRLDVPWPLVGAAILLAVGCPTAAAWWPARTIARIPVTQALSGRPPQPKPAHRSAVLAILLIATGVICLYVANERNGLLVVIGTLASVLGVLFIGPMATRALAAVASRLPFAIRLPLRDLARHQARSGSALAAISLAVGIPVAIIIIATAAQPSAGEGNLSDRQLLVGIGNIEGSLVPDRKPAELVAIRSRIDRFAATLGPAKVAALDRPMEPGATRETGSEGRGGGRPAVGLGKPVNADTLMDVPVFVATPELLRLYGADPATDADLLTVRTGEFKLIPMTKRTEPEAVAKVRRLSAPAYSSAPTSLITLAALRRHGWTMARAGWFVQAERPITKAQLAQARDLAKENGLTIEARSDRRTTMAAIRSGATTAGVLLALGVLAMTVGLIRGETSRDLRTLTAVGATGRTRRTLTATTAGALALLGALLGTAGTYLALIAGYSNNLHVLDRVPVAHLAAIVAGLPLLAAAAGWLLSGS